MAEEEYEPDYDDGDFGGDDIDGDDIEEAGDEAEGGIENIDVGLVFYKIFNFVSAESWSWFGIVHSAVIGATSNIPIRRATTFEIHATNFQRYQIALLSINH